MAVGGDLNATEPALNFWSAWRQLKTTSLILAHVRKNESDSTAARSVYGNQYYTAEARCIWEVKKQQEAGEDCLEIALFNRKPPPFAKVHNSMGLHFDFDEIDENGIAHAVKVCANDPENVADFVKQMGVKGTQIQILDLLREGAKSNDEISELLGLTKNNTYVAINRLTKKDKIVKLQGGKWGLAFRG